MNHSYGMLRGGGGGGRKQLEENPNRLVKGGGGSAPATVIYKERRKSEGDWGVSTRFKSGEVVCWAVSFSFGTAESSWIRMKTRLSEKTRGKRLASAPGLKQEVKKHGYQHAGIF